MSGKEPTIVTQNINKGVGGLRISKWKYDAVKEAILETVPRNAEGILFKDLPAAIAPRLYQGGSGQDRLHELVHDRRQARLGSPRPD